MKYLKIYLEVELIGNLGFGKQAKSIILNRRITIGGNNVVKKITVGFSNTFWRWVLK